MADQRTVIDEGASQRRRDEQQERNHPYAQQSGINHTAITGPQPAYNAAQSDTIYAGSTNAFIIMGKDKPRDNKSGTGAKPQTHCAAIDIVAGMTGIMAKEEIDFEKVMTNKSPELDAARIYISQMCSLDDEEYFNITEGNVGSPENVSGIALKADSIRVIGRQGIKLVTGTDTFNVPGFNISMYQYGIDLITGNDESELEPMVRGESLSLFCEQLLQLQSDLNAAMTAFLRGRAEGKKILAATEGLGIVAAMVAEAAGETAATEILATHLKNIGLASLNYLTFFGDGYFLSRNNQTN